MVISARRLRADSLLDQRLIPMLVNNLRRFACNGLFETTLWATSPLLPLSSANGGNDPIAHEQTDIDVIAADSLDKTILFGECKWRNSFNETEAIEKLHQRAGLVRGYQAGNAWLMLFTKNPVSESTRTRYMDDERMVFVSTEELYTA